MPNSVKTVTVKNSVITIAKTDAFKLSLMANSVKANRPSFHSIKVKLGDQAAELYTESARDIATRPERLTLKSSVGEVVHLFPEDVAWLERVIADTQS
jgi:D-Tyr-tRNAtyr deacylase